MLLFVIFVFGAVLLGAGAMLAPAWHSRQPRIGLMAALALGLVVGGAVFWAEAFGWNTLIIDYMLFALVSAILLGGTLSQAQARAEARGEVLLDADQGWPGPRDLAFFALAALVFILLALVPPVPMDGGGQGLGYLALMARMGGTFNTLAPFHPEISYLFPPGLTALTAYLSQQLNQPIPTIQLGTGAVFGFLCVLLAYDLGAELEDKRLGRAMAAAMVGGLALFGAFLHAYFTGLMGLLFALSSVTFALRFQRDRGRADMVAAGLMLGATVLADPTIAVLLMTGYLVWLATMWLGRPRPTAKSWLALAIGVPLVAGIGLAPWLANTAGQLMDAAPSYTRDGSYLLALVVLHGVVIVPLVVIGAVVRLRRRDQSALLAVGWLALAADFAAVGVVSTILPLPGRYADPLQVAWLGPILPYTILGGWGLLWVYDRYVKTRWGGPLRERAYLLFGAAGAVAVVAALAAGGLLATLKDTPQIPSPDATYDDVAAMLWLRENAAPDARVLNAPGPGGLWTAVIAERDSVYFPQMPIFSGTDAANEEGNRLRAFWDNPADPANAALLAEARIDYVILPQDAGDPNGGAAQSRAADSPYLQLAFDSNGAQVYRVTGSG